MNEIYFTFSRCPFFLKCCHFDTRSGRERGREREREREREKRERERERERERNVVKDDDLLLSTRILQKIGSYINFVLSLHVV